MWTLFRQGARPSASVWCRHGAARRRPDAGPRRDGRRARLLVHGRERPFRYDLRSLQDWFIRYQLNAVPGVAEVASVGGHVQQYQIDVDPNRLRAYNLSLGAVVEAVRNSNQNVGGNVLEANGTWSIVRGVGLIESVQDLEQIVVSAPAGVPVYVRHVAQVRIGDAFRVASLVKGRDEAVGGVIVVRSGANAQRVIDGVKARIAQISPGLPAGVRIVPFYDRSTLIAQAVDTLRTTLLEERLPSSRSPTSSF